MAQAAANSSNYRILPTIARRPAPGEPGTLRQQLSAIASYLDEQEAERRTGTQAKRLWTVCHCLATNQPIPMVVTLTNGGAS